MVNNLYALRHQLKFRMHVIEPAHIINGTQILAQALFSKFHALLRF